MYLEECHVCLATVDFNTRALDSSSRAKELDRLIYFSDCSLWIVCSLVNLLFFITFTFQY